MSHKSSIAVSEEGEQQEEEKILKREKLIQKAKYSSIEK